MINFWFFGLFIEPLFIVYYLHGTKIPGIAGVVYAVFRILGRRQVVSHRVLAPACTGPNPVVPGGLLSPKRKSHEFSCSIKVCGQPHQIGVMYG